MVLVIISVFIISSSRAGLETRKWVDGVFVEFLLIVFVVRLLILLRNLSRLILGVVSFASLCRNHLSMTLGVACILRSTIPLICFSSSLYHA